MAIAGISHVSLTVTDLRVSSEWYTQVLGWQCLAEDRSETTWFAYGRLPDGTTVVLRQHDSPVTGPFDERRPGLDHLSLTYTDVSDLEELSAKLAATGSTWSPVQETPHARVLNFRDPDNTAIEATVGVSA